MKHWNQQSRLSLNELEEDYLSKDVFSQTDGMMELKDIIKNDLSDTDRAILLVYSEKGSMAKTGKIFCVSPATICDRMKQIRLQIKTKLDKELN